MEDPHGAVSSARREFAAAGIQMRTVRGRSCLWLSTKVPDPVNRQGASSMRRFALSSAVVLCATVVFGGHGYAQVSGRGGRGRGLAVGQPAPAIKPAYYMGCVGGGNLQPVEQ